MVSIFIRTFSGNLNFRIEKVSTPPNPGYPDDIQIMGTYDGFGMEIYLNSEKIGAESSHIQGTGKGYASGEIYNLLRIQLAFGDGDIGTVTVNGKTITLPEGTKDTVEFTIAPASEYVIEVTKKPTIIPRTIIWAKDKTGNNGLKDYELLKNGTLEILEIKNPDGTSIGLDGVKQDTNYGWASVISGSEIILRAVPEYGYQLESITINGQSLTPLSDASTFSYTMPDENVHISSIFTKAEDQVELKTDKVKRALIQLAENEITSGNSRLTIKDAVLTQQQLEAFKKAAGDYQITGYFDIKLAQILYKNTAANLWVNNIETLKKTAKVSLQIEADWESENSELAVIHEKKDGTYEIIPASFDVATKMVMFQTDGFSNYAIAYKKVETTTEDQTGATTEDPSEDTTGDVTEASTEETTEPETVEQEPTEKAEEPAAGKNIDDIGAYFSVSDVRNDVTGNWRISTIAENIDVQEYALSYYKEYFKDDKEIHAIVNFNYKTTTKISVIGNTLDVSIYDYVDGEEHDAKLLFSGTLLKEYSVNMDNGSIEEIQ